jgi:hypothetical protein
MVELTRRGLVRYEDLMMDNARWDDFVLRSGDIIISTPAKAGTTWMQMICALLIFQDPDLPKPLDELSPWLEMQTRSVDDAYAHLEAQHHRRFIKSHTPFDGLPYDEHVTYICVGRDPRDTAVSLLNHRANMDFDAFLAARATAVGTDDLEEKLGSDDDNRHAPATPTEKLLDYIETDDPEKASLADTLQHLKSFWAVRDRSNVILVHYTALQENLEGEMRMLARRLAIDVPEQNWPALVEAATFDAMRSRADALVPESGVSLWRDNKRFFNKGTTGQWRDLLDELGLSRYVTRVRALADEEFIDWLHHGALT